MYIIKPYSKLNYDDLDIFSYYIPKFSLGKCILSPLRNEKNPSFNIYEKKGKYYWKDFGNGEHGDAVNFVMRLFGLTYHGAINKINYDLSGTTSFLGLSRPKIDKKDFKNIQIKIKPYNKEAIDYWLNYGINLNLLEEYNTYNISNYWIDNKIYYVSNKLVFAYRFFENNINTFKIYDTSKTTNKNKWFTNCSSDIIQGYSQLISHGDLLIITKALKDVMCLKSMNYISIAPQSENILISEDKIEKLKKRFTKIVTLFDNDEAGVRCGEKYKDIYQIEKYNIPGDLDQKDISDFYKKNKEEETIKLLSNLIKNDS